MSHEHLDRREFLKNTLLPGVIAIALGPHTFIEARADDPQERIQKETKRRFSVVGIVLDGGMSQAEFLDPHPETFSTYQSGIGAIPAANKDIYSAVFPKLAGVADKITTVRTFHSPLGSLDHRLHTEQLLLDEKEKNFHAKLIDDIPAKERALIDYLYMEASFPGENFGFEGNPNGVFRNNDPPHEKGRSFTARYSEAQGYFLPVPYSPDIRRRVPLLLTLDHPQFSSKNVERQQELIQKAIAFFLGKGTRAFEPPPEKKLEQYGSTPIGRALTLAGELIKEGVPSIVVRCGHWDFHDKIKEVMEVRAPEIDKAASAFITDLERGEIPESVVWCASEFGRTPQISRSFGRDHWREAHAGFFYGGKFHKGLIYGATTKDWEPRADAMRIPIADIKHIVRFATGFPTDDAVVEQHRKLFTKI